MFPKLFSPIKLGPLEIRNRVAMPAFGLLYGDKRRCSQRMVDFYEARAKGGCGLLIVGGIGIDLLGSGWAMPTLEADEYIPGFARLAEACHRHGAKVFVQLFHSGRYQHSMLINGQKAVAPSAVASRYTKEVPRELRREEILEIEEKYAAAAERAKKAGLDGVEIIASAGYLISQFLSPLTNLRNDDYGGGFENRVRFGREVIEKVRARVGKDFAVTVRVAGNDFMPGSNRNPEAIQACQVFVRAGADAINVTGGWHETQVPQLPMMVPRGAFVYLAAGIRRAVSVPVLASNRIVAPAQAEEILADGLADMLCVGRAQIADPEWANKAREGRPAEIRPCVGCMQGCMDRIFSGKPLSCLCNPQAGYEAERKLEPTAAPKRIVVVGAGPGGLEAACTAARRGHQVTVLEKTKTIGGQLPLVAAPPGREEFGSLLKYYQAEVKRLKIAVKFGKAATAAMVKRMKPDAVIVATGSEAMVPAIPGVDRPEVITAWSALSGRADLGRRVAIIGGGAVGVETAIFIAAKGTLPAEVLKFLFLNEAEDVDTLRRLASQGSHEVTIVEMLPRLGQDLGQTSRWVLMKELKTLGVKTLTEAKVMEIQEGEVIYQSGDLRKSLACDSVVLALGSRSVDGLALELEQGGLPVGKVGDTISPRKVMDAVHEGFLAAREL